jgi:transcriptional repressor NrdR
MRCPFCLNDDSQVKDSRPTDDGGAIRRRRQCPACGARFTTFERVQLREITVVKKSGRREPFDRDKLARSVAVACRKRPVAPEQVERMVSGVVRRLETIGDAEVDTDRIGQLVMEGLQALDPVAYIRFASVYKEFREPADFEAFVGTLGATARELARGSGAGQAELPGLEETPARERGGGR